MKMNAALALDLRDVDILKRLQITKEQIEEDRWIDAIDSGSESLCQAIGRAASASAIEILLVPSAQDPTLEEFNIVLIVENAPPGSGKWRPQNTNT